MSIHEVTIIALGVVGLMVSSAFFSGSETALFSLKSPLLRRWGREGTHGQKRAAELMTDHHETLVAILFGTNLVNILIAVLVNRLASGLGGGEHAPLIAGFAATTLLLIFGEVTPKTIAYGKAESISARVSPIIWWVRRLLYPAIVVLTRLSRAFLDTLGPAPVRAPLTAEEFQTFITLGENMSAFSPKEAELLREIFTLREQTVAGAMIPRVDVCSVDVAWDGERVEQEIRRFRHRRLAVVDGTLDDLVGVLDVRHYFQASAEKREQWAKALVSAPNYVPEHASMEKALAMLRTTRAGMVFVVDEYGGIAGILTMEDLLEEVVGELTDEYDVPLWQHSQLSLTRWRFSGMVPLQDLQDATGFEAPSDSLADTAGGLMAEVLGHIPAAGEVVTLGRACFTVRSVAHKRVVAFDLELLPVESDDSAAGGEST